MGKIASQKNKEFAPKPSNRIAIYVLGFFIPLYSLSIRLFVEWSWYKLLPFILIVIILVRRRKRCAPRKDIFQWAVILIYFMFAITVVNYLSNIQSGRFHYAIDIGQHYLRAYGHMAIQFVMIVACLLQLFLWPYLIKSKNDVDAFIRGFINGNIISVLFGIIQYAAHRLDISWGWLNICYVMSPVGKVFRMSGLGGEPKQFGAFLVLGLLIILTNYLSNKPIAIKKALIKTGILITGLLLSFSTSAWLGFTFACMAIIVLTLNARRLTIVVGIVLCFAGLNFSEKIKQAIDDRLLNRMQSFETFLSYAPKDALALYLAKDNLFIALLGTGAGGMHYHVMNTVFLEDVPYAIRRAGIISVVYKDEATVSMSPGSFVIKHLTEYGVIGVILWIIAVWNIVKRIRTTRYGRFAMLLSISVLVAAVPTSSMFVFSYFSLLTLLYGYYYNQTLHAKMPIDRFHLQLEQN